MNISKATRKDIPKLVALINTSYRGEESKKGWTTEAELLDGIRTNQDTLEQMMMGQHSVFLKFCNEDNVLEGCVYLEKKENKMYLGMLTVSPLQQAKGIGKKLLFASEEYAREQKCFIIEMNVISVRNELIDWYQRHDYYKTGQNKSFPSDTKFGIPKQPLEFIVLQKDV